VGHPVLVFLGEPEGWLISAQGADKRFAVQPAE